MPERVAIILAAGKSTRMITQLPKVLHEVCGRPMLAYVLDACRKSAITKIYVIVGYGKEQIIERFAGQDDLVFVEQKEQKGTGHAVMCCSEYLKDFDGDTLILCGDGPLIRPQTLQTLINKHDTETSMATLATAILEDPTGYGRIDRDSYGNLQGIVEHSDCNEKQLQIKEVNPSYYCFNNKVLQDFLTKIKPNNVKNEYYLTDAVRLILTGGYKVTAVTAVEPEEALGVNSRQQLSDAGKIMQRRIQETLMSAGVTIVDPPNTWIDARAEIGRDTVIEPFTYIHGEVKIGENCRVGPFAYLRQGTVLMDDVVLGVFTEVKDATLNQGVRARHLSYLGNANIGKNVNVGAGTITANYDGQRICETNIGDGCFIGPGSVLIAPIEIPKGTQVQAGTALTNDTLERPDNCS